MSRTRYFLAVIAAGTFASACDSLSPTGIGGDGEPARFGTGRAAIAAGRGHTKNTDDQGR